MTDIELIIKISEDSYKATCSGSMLPPDVENIVNAIKNGTSLDKIRAEIEEMTPTYHNNDWSITDLVPISEVLKIVDKYKAEGSEE